MTSCNVIGLTRPSVSTLKDLTVAECNLAIKEENELLKEQELIRMEFIERLEKKHDQLETEVGFAYHLTRYSLLSTRSRTQS